MSQLEAPVLPTPPATPVSRGRRSSGSPTWSVPRQVWPIVAMLAMIPILVVLLLALFV